jgi:hypothetical protein
VLRILQGDAPDRAMDLIAFGKQELREIRSILAGNSGNQRALIHSRQRCIPSRMRSLVCFRSKWLPVKPNPHYKRESGNESAAIRYRHGVASLKISASARPAFRMLSKAHSIIS